MDLFRTRRDGLIIHDPQPIDTATDIWKLAAHVATVGIFVLLLGLGLYLCRSILMPMVAAMVVGLTLAPLVSRAERQGVPPWLTALGLAILLMAGVTIIATLMVAPMTEWINRAPEIGAIVKQKFSLLVQPLGSLRELQNILMPSGEIVTPVLAFVTPAVTELIIFFIALLFFLAGQTEIRRYLPAPFTSRDARLRVIRIINDVESNLASYLAIVTVINGCIGLIVAAGAWLLGIPNPLLFGLLAAGLNYIPYIGPALMIAILFGVGLVAFPSIERALLPPICFIGLVTVEGQIITPAVLGSRLPLKPLAIFLSLAFWAWLWGPIGAFLAVPLTIIGRIIIGHVFPSEQPNLPD